MDSQKNTLVIRLYPYSSWFIGLLALVYAGWSYYQKPSWLLGPGIGIGFFLLLILLSPTVTITADRIKRTLTIQRSRLVSRKSREIPVSEIAAIQVENTRSSSSTGRGSSTVYRVVVVTRGNETIPFTTTYSSGSASKEQKVRRLREFLGVGGVEASSVGAIQMAASLVQTALQQQQEAQTGPEAGDHITDGVHWKVQTAVFGGTAVTRWFSPDFQCPGGFVYLAQKVAGRGAGGGLLGGLNKILYQQTISLYGFGEQDTPGMNKAELIPSLDAGLDQHFGIFTSDPAVARQILNAWAIAPLVDWGTRYPLQQMQKSGPFKQLVVMFSPRGTYVASMGTMFPEALDELTNLGVALVKAK